MMFFKTFFIWQGGGTRPADGMSFIIIKDGMNCLKSGKNVCMEKKGLRSGVTPDLNPAKNYEENSKYDSELEILFEGKTVRCAVPSGYNSIFSPLECGATPHSRGNNGFNAEDVNLRDCDCLSSVTRQKNFFPNFRNIQKIHEYEGHDSIEINYKSHDPPRFPYITWRSGGAPDPRGNQDSSCYGRVKTNYIDGSSYFMDPDEIFSDIRTNSSANYLGQDDCSRNIIHIVTLPTENFVSGEITFEMKVKSCQEKTNYPEFQNFQNFYKMEGHYFNKEIFEDCNPPRLSCGSCRSGGAPDPLEILNSNCYDHGKINYANDFFNVDSGTIISDNCTCYTATYPDQVEYLLKFYQTVTPPTGNFVPGEITFWMKMKFCQEKKFLP